MHPIRNDESRYVYRISGYNMNRVIFSLMLALIFSVNANGFSCKGEVLSIAIGPTSGVLQVNAGHGVHYLCKLSGELNGVHQETCKAWYSMFLTAQASGRAVEQYYADSGNEGCAGLGSWVTPNPIPYYVVINK